MLYYYENNAHLMLGTEKLPIVKQLLKQLSEEDLQMLLNYTFFCYNETPVNPYINMLPAQRKEYVVETLNLIDARRIGVKEAIESYESEPHIKEFIEQYLLVSLSTYERQKRIYLKKIENYMLILADPLSSAAAEVEADKMIELFNKRLQELEQKIQEEKEAKTDGSNAVLHLFELPKTVAKFYADNGIILN